MIRRLGEIFSKILVVGFLCMPFISVAQIDIGDDLSKINYDHPVDYYIGGIEVEGVKYFDKNVIIMLSQLEVGERIKVPGEAITSAIRKLWSQGLFDNIKITASKIEGGKIYLKLYVQERPRLSKFSFDGIRKSEADDIREKINLTRGDVVTDHLMIRTINIIKDYYADKGFLNADVSIREKPDKTQENFEELVVKIRKKKKVRIEYIDIVGNKDLSDDAVKGAMKETKVKGNFNPLDSIGPLIINLGGDALRFKFKKFRDDLLDYFTENYRVRLFKGSKYIETNYKDDLDLIVAKYNKKGYRDAHITGDSIIRVNDQNIGIKIFLEEGNKYYFRNIAWVGNTVYSSAFLSTVLGIQKGDVYNKELLETNLNFNPNGFDVSSLYMDNGYLFFNATPVEVYVENDSIDMEIRIYEGDQARIRNVTVRGNDKTNDHVIIRELRTRPGQLFSRSDIIRTQRELANLRYFNAETITPNIKPDPANGTVDIEWDVEETSADQIELSGGWGYGRIIGTLGLSFNNFSIKSLFKKGAWRPVPSGDGQKLSLRFQTYGKGYMNWSISFTEPWLGGKKPNALTVSYYHSLYSNGYPKSDTNRSSFVTDGITIGIGKRLTWPDDFFTLYNGVNVLLYKLQNYGTIFPVGSGTGSYNNISYEVILGRNSVSQPIYPRNGSDISVGLEMTPPYSLFSNKDYSDLTDDERYKWIEYYKIKVKAYWYFEFFDKLVLAAKFRFGYLGHYNEELGTTPFERFFLGGDGLTGYYNYDGREVIAMRGYENESISAYYRGAKNIGGTVFTRNTLEIRYPLSLNPSSTIYGLAFVEAGNTWLQPQGFDPFDLKRSAGVGIRVYLPMFGMLGLDWAYGFDPIPGWPSASGSHFHFSMNQSLD
ncbi:MAG: outer membrane protein assembly factor BamA [Bacteroidetes bacterium]|nr:MAG: outer membrane protein assembly factor BamA [Bacteroidota bacterium]RLD73051.1 MAG: outer membrane protein assembly factor BamA [Bacteroidota bacterium]RLD88436.1 MAG: outer membrane protein assembly factor BamA [Bacteroidota bacterium]